MQKKYICVVLAAVLLLSILAVGPFQARAVSNMTLSDMGEAMIKAFEGFGEQPKWDQKHHSVGWGCTIDLERWSITDKNDPRYVDKLTDENGNYIKRENPATGELDYVISETGAQTLFNEHMVSHCEAVNKFANKNGLTFTQGQFDALVSLSYNIGDSWMTSSEKGYYLRTAILNHDTEAELAYAFALYSTSGGVTTQGHLKRRLLELQMYLYEVYDTDKNWPQDLRYVLLDGNGGTVNYNPNGFNINYPTEVRGVVTAPTGKDENGNTFTYELAGWFTKPEGGQQVTELNRSFYNGMILYAQWKDPNTGKIVTFPRGEAADVQVQVTGSSALREGPSTYYTSVRTANKDELLHITKTILGNDGKMWGQTAEGWIRLDATNYGTTAVEGTWGTVKGDGVNIRKGPGTSYDKTGTKKNSGDRVLITEVQTESGSTRQWGKMSDGNWICMDYVTLDDKTDSTPAKPDITGAITVESVEIQDEPKVKKYGWNSLDRIPDVTGGRIKVTYSNGTRKWIDITRGMVSGFDNTQLGTVTITVSVGGKKDTYNVEIVPVDVISISMDTYPVKVQYLKDTETLDLTGVTIELQYTPYGTETLPVTPDMVSGFDNTVKGTQEITVTYKEFTTTFFVEVVTDDLVGISLKNLPTKLKYLLDTETLDLTGAVLEAEYSYTGVKTIPLTAEMVTGFDNTAPGRKVLTVTYEGKTTTFEVDVVTNELISIEMDRLPGKLQYLQGREDLDLTGAQLKLIYSHSEPEVVLVTPEMITGFDNRTGGKKKLTVTYQGKTTTFEVEILLYTIVFKNYDGTVLFSGQYALGDAVTPPADPMRQPDRKGEYAFVGWDKEVVACDGNAEYTAVYEILYHAGDVDRNHVVNEDDAIYLLRHVVFPEKYPIHVVADYDGDGDVDGDDAIYLLRHVVFPDKYPLN